MRWYLVNVAHARDGMWVLVMLVGMDMNLVESLSVLLTETWHRVDLKT